MKVVDIAFYGFVHGGHVPSMDAFLARWWFLTDHYTFNEVPMEGEPDIVYFTGQWHQPLPHIKIDAQRVFVTGENIKPDWDKHEWAFTFERSVKNERHFRMPEWVHWLWSVGIPPETLIRSEHEKMDKKDKFCLFVQRNPVHWREQFVQELSRYKPVDCLGPRLNNKGFTIPFRQTNGKIFEVMRDYKFVIVFENESYPGYNVRMGNPMVSRCIPIYWGDPLIEYDFNHRSFIHVKGPNDMERAINHITLLDQNDGLYNRKWAEPYYIGNALPNYANREKLLKQWQKILGD